MCDNDGRSESIRDGGGKRRRGRRAALVADDMMHWKQLRGEEETRVFAL